MRSRHCGSRWKRWGCRDVNGDRHRELRELLGAYVLDQLGEREQTMVEAHTAGCSACQAELAELRPVAAALRGLDPTLAAEPVLPEDLGERVVRQIHARRQAVARGTRIRRGAGALLVAASAAAAFGIGTWWAGPRTDPPVVPVALRLIEPGVQANAGLVKHTWGTELKLQASGLADGRELLGHLRPRRRSPGERRQLSRHRPEHGDLQRQRRTAHRRRGGADHHRRFGLGRDGGAGLVRAAREDLLSVLRFRTVALTLMIALNSRASFDLPRPSR